MSLGHTLIGAAVIAVAVAGVTGWLITSGARSDARVDFSYPEGIAAVVPLGLPAGGNPRLSISAANPLSGDTAAVQEGKKLFVSMNCAGCHGYDAKGSMGPDLTDPAWRYGGTPIDIYKSIYEVRPQGMPAWGNALPPQTIWQLTAYIQSLGGAFAASSGGTIQPAGVEQGQKQ